MSPMSRLQERTIDSPRHPAVRRARALERDREERGRRGLYLAWGLHLAQEALAAAAPLREVFLGPRVSESAEGRALALRIVRAGTPIARTTTRILEGIADGSGDQGILFVVALPATSLAAILERRPTLILAAHGVQDPGNLGSMARTAWGFGADAFVALEGCADPFGSRSVRAGMGATFALPMVRSAPATEAVEALRGAGVQILAGDPAGPELPTAVDLTRPAALLVGSEGLGLPDVLLRAADRRQRGFRWG
jgi:TrmH family RNA methyltransferase